MKSVYTGGEKVAEFEGYDELRVGDGNPAFIYEGNELVYPNPVKDGLVLWYDFSGRTNTDGQRGIAEDLSGNGNHGTLQNFNYTPESGYDKNKLLFDGVDDFVDFTSLVSGENGWSMELVANFVDWEGTSWVSIFGYLNTHTIFVHPTGGLSWYINYEGTTFLVYSEITKSNIPTNTPVYISVNCKYLIDNKAEITFRVNDRMKVSNSELNPSYSGFKPNTLGANTGSRMMEWSPSSAKFYNRPLTPEEIAHNYAIEKERFGIE